MALGVSAAVMAPAFAAAAPPPVPSGAYETAGTRGQWYELRLPAAAPQGIVLAFHGGGWEAVGPGLVRGLSGYRGGELERKWRARGFITVTSTYRAHAPGFTDVVTVYDQLHARYPQLPIGAYGQSAGAHLAMLLGAARELAFVVSDAGPTDWATWKSTYPCFNKNCSGVATVNGQSTASLGAWWVDDKVVKAFGAASDPAPNLNDYDVAPNYDATHGPDPFLIYGRRALPSDPAHTQLADERPLDGPFGNAYVDSDNDGATTGDQLESDIHVTQQQGVLLKNRVGARAILRTLPKGSVPWVHGPVDGAAAAAAYNEMIDWTVAHAAAAAPAPAVAERQNVGLANLDNQPVGTYAVRACNAAPGHSGVFATGAWEPSVSDVAGIDAVESGCSTEGSAVTAGEGMQMRTEPLATGVIARDAASSMTFRAPPGTTISSYGASYHGARSSNVWEMSLVARDAAGAATTLTRCDAAAPCTSTLANDLVPPGTTSATDGPYPPRTFTPPTGTVSLTWQLACRAAGGCPGGSSGNAKHLNQQAFLNVYASAVYISDPTGPPAPTLTGDFGDGLPHKGALSGTVEAGDAAGIRSIEATFAGKTQTTTLDCDYSRPRPCPATASLPLSGDTAGLPEGSQPVAITVTDGSGRVTAGAGAVTIQNITPVVFAASAPPPRRPNPFASGHGREQLASCSTGPSVIAAALSGRRLKVTAVAAARLAGKRAALRIEGRTLATATIGAGGVVSVQRQLRPHDLGTAFTISAGGRSSPRIAVRAPVTLSARRTGKRVRLSGTVRRGGRRVEIQRLVACGRWRTIASAKTSKSRRFGADIGAGTAPGGAYRARVVASRSVARLVGSRATSIVAVT
ncbi:MAG TPA: hypothetical protein VF526_19110 [Solirubrobacteraceae bacterium]